MNSVNTLSRTAGRWLWPILLAPMFAGTAAAQVPVDENGEPIPAMEQDSGEPVASTAGAEGELLASSELEELVGPIALYPDDLLAIVLPASTYPLEIVQAARFLDELEKDSSLKPDDSWDDSVVALLNYPDVVRKMNDDIDWTWRLGEAVIAQQADVIAAIEQFRDRAYAAGNLKSDERQNVTVEEGNIEIEPVDDEIIYVPYYDPAEVVVYQPRPVYYYYPDPYPVYYYPYPAGYSFYGGYFWGVTTAFQIGWSNHYLHVYHPSYWGHPYYGRYYYDYYYYRRPSVTVYNTWYVNNSYHPSNYRYRDGDYWRPRHRAGSRPDEPRVRNYYYPPNGGSGSGSVAVSSGGSRRDSLPVREDGRMSLNLRERNGVAGRVADTRSQGFRGNADTGRSVARGNGRTDPNLRDGAAGRTGATRGQGAGSNGGGATAQPGGAAGRSADTRSQGFRANGNGSATPNTGTRTFANRSPAGGTSDRPAFQFRDRSDDRSTAGTNRQAPVNSRPTTGGARVGTSRGNDTGARGAGISRGPTGGAGRSDRSTAVPGQGLTSSGSDRRGSMIERSGGSFAQPSSPTVRQSAPVTRQSAPTVRQAAPTVRQAAPTVRQSAPTVRQAAPTMRQSAPSFSGSAPAARPSAPAVSRGQSSQGSARGASRGERASNRGSGSRPRNHD